MKKNHYVLISICSLLLMVVILNICTSKSSNNISTNTVINKNFKDYSELFQKDKIININISITKNNWNDMLSNADAKIYHVADISIDGQKLNSVGIRTKGFSSLSSVTLNKSNRYSFHIKFNKYVKSQKLCGLDNIVLNNGFQDPSYMREYLSYEALDYLGADTPYRVYSNLYVNGQLVGFYLCLESYNDSFCNRISSNNKDVNLYKAAGESCTLKNTESLKYFNLQKGTDKDKTYLSKLVNVLNNMKDGQKGDIESILDVDSALKAFAVNTVVGNYDSYNGSKAHNYYLMEINGKLRYIPWDFNLSIGGFTEDNGMSVATSIAEPIYNTSLSERPLIQKLLSVDEYRERYYGYIDKLLQYFSNFNTRVNSLSSIIKPYVKDDPSAFYSIDDFEENIKESGKDLTKISESLPNTSALTNRNTSNKMPNLNNIGDLTTKSKENNAPIMAGFDINHVPVSIMDYITQRVNNIKAQMSTLK